MTPSIAIPPSTSTPSSTIGVTASESVAAPSFASRLSTGPPAISDQLGYGYQFNAVPAQQACDTSTDLLGPASWQFGLSPSTSQRQYQNDGTLDAFVNQYNAQLQPQAIDFLSPNLAAHPMASDLSTDTSLSAAYNATVEPLNPTLAFSMGECAHELFATNDNVAGTEYMHHNLHSSSTSDSTFEIRSQSSSDNGWNLIDFPSGRSFDSFQDSATPSAVSSSAASTYPAVSTAGLAGIGSSNICVDPTQTVSVHVRANSESSGSDAPLSAYSFSSWEDITFPLRSPEPDINRDAASLQQQQQQQQNVTQPQRTISSPVQKRSLPLQHRTITPSVVNGPLVVQSPAPAAPSASVRSTSPNSGGSRCSPSRRRRKSPNSSKINKAAVTKKTSPSQGARKDVPGERRVGRRKGPLRPDQRQQAHEIRKLRACLRCKFLKKTCDKGDPCGGCQPSHARLWQVPCTRIDIKDVNFFMKEWKADFQRHVNMTSSVANIKGFSSYERPLFVTHGYGVFLPIDAREVYVHDDSGFGLDWVEAFDVEPKEYEVTTAKLSAGSKGISSDILSQYLDRHIDGNFEYFIDEYYGGTVFITELLKTAYRYYLKKQLPIIRKALKLVVAYNLTTHVTMIKGMTEEESKYGRIDNESSRYYGETMAPVMINFQVKFAMAEMWRELQKEVLEGLSALYSSVYSGEKLKNWPTIFVLASILLLVWEQMQFDAQYRAPDCASTQKFCHEMETIPVGVVVGLFQAISQKLPAFKEWDTQKHQQLLNSDEAVCNAMTEVQEHVSKYGKSIIFSHFSSVCMILYSNFHPRGLSKITRRCQIRS